MLRQASLVALFLVAASVGARAQTAEVIRGRITDDSSRAIVATVIVTRGPDRLTQTDTTDAAGNFSVRFEQGTGDYLVYVSAPGYKSARRRIQRETTETEFVANFSLARDLALLDTVKVRAQKPVRASNSVNPTQLETGSPEKWLNGISGLIPPTVAGDLNAIAGTMSNVTMTGGGASILGS